MEKAYVNGHQKDFSKMRKIGSSNVNGSTFTMYVTERNKYYLHCTGITSYAASIDFAEAKQWAEKNLTPSEYADEFENSEKRNRSFNCNLSRETSEFLERTRINTGKSYGDILSESIRFLAENDCTPCGITSFDAEYNVNIRFTVQTSILSLANNIAAITNKTRTEVIENAIKAYAKHLGETQSS